MAAVRKEEVEEAVKNAVAPIIANQAQHSATLHPPAFRLSAAMRAPRTLLLCLTIQTAQAACLPATGCRDGAGFEEGVDYYGNDAGNVTNVTSAADCCAACTADAGCSFWTLATDDHVCFKKTSDAGRNPVTDRVSGPAQTPTPPSPSTEGRWKPIAVMSVPRQGLGIGE